MLVNIDVLIIVPRSVRFPPTLYYIPQFDTTHRDPTLGLTSSQSPQNVNKSKPNLAQAHEFGSKVYVHLQDTGKLEAKAEEAVFVGVDDQSKGYRIYWAGRPGKRVSIERNVSFVPTTVTVAADVLSVGETALPIRSGTSRN